MNSTLSGRAAIAGIGATEFSKDSGRSELRLAAEAVRAAVADAGLQPSDVDGLVTFTMDTSEEMEVARSLGMREISMFTRVPYGGGASAAVVMQAAMAVATGVAEYVVCYRAFNERSGNRFGTMSGITTMPLWLSWYGPYGSPVGVLRRGSSTRCRGVSQRCVVMSMLPQKARASSTTTIFW